MGPFNKVSSMMVLSIDLSSNPEFHLDLGGSNYPAFTTLTLQDAYLKLTQYTGEAPFWLISPSLDTTNPTNRLAYLIPQTRTYLNSSYPIKYPAVKFSLRDDNNQPILHGKLYLTINLS